MTDMITWILKKRTFSEKEIRDIVKRDLPTHHLRRKPAAWHKADKWYGRKGGQDENSANQG